MSENVVPFRGGLSRAAAERRIREVAADTSAIEFPWNTAKQMAASEVTMRQAIETLRHGAVSENPTENEHGDWLCVLRKRTAGRIVHLVVALSSAHRLTVVGAR